MPDLTAPPGLLGLYAKAVLPAPSRGDTLPDSVYRLAGRAVDLDHLARYQQVCGFPVSHQLPPTYLSALAFPVSVALMTQRSFPVPLLGLLHIRNAITVARPTSADDRIDVEVRVADLRPHRAGRQFDVVVETRVDAAVVWSGRSTYLHREKAAARPEPAIRAVPEPLGPRAQVRVAADIGRRYAAVSADRNPVHLSKATARLFGFPRAIAHGMWLAARTLAVLEGRLPDAYTVDVAFKAPVLLPSTVAIGTRRDDREWLLDVRNARSGTLHLTGRIQPG
ncbi:MAG TPA: MaoC/PaaZ C-terminal domain-containing protein [Jatrophihabitans sp.]|nr:MaoC/PaaZ C-terminal domain-containing protein [Jatrophihabitans sp.]